jgi:hypothetical protein
MLSFPQVGGFIHSMSEFELVIEDDCKIHPLDEGVDELNIAEFPLAVFSQRPKGSEVVYKNQVYCKKTRQSISRSLTISAGSGNKLPTPFDSNVVLGLLQYYDRIDDEKYQEISLREVATVLGLDTGGRTIKRIKESIDLWFEIGLTYENAWFNARDKRWEDAKFRIVDAAINNEDSYKIRWGREFLQSLEANYVRPLNLELFRSLNNPLAQTLFRYLDKKFFRQNQLDYDLENLAFNHLGIPTNTSNGDIKRRLKPALEILESTSFFARDTARYYKQKRKWRIRFQKVIEVDELEDLGSEDLFEKNEPVTKLRKRLLSVSISENQISELHKEYDEERIGRCLEIALFYKANNPKKIRSFAPYLLKVIENDTPYPEGFVTENQRQENELKRTEKSRKEHEEMLVKKHQADRECDETRSKVDNYLETLGEEGSEDFIKSIDFGVNKHRGSILWYLEIEEFIDKLT